MPHLMRAWGCATAHPKLPSAASSIPSPGLSTRSGRCAHLARPPVLTKSGRLWLTICYSRVSYNGGSTRCLHSCDLLDGAEEFMGTWVCRLRGRVLSLQASS